jgi:hypothetical protein
MKLNPAAHPRQLHGPRYASTGYSSGAPVRARAPGRLTLGTAAVRDIRMRTGNEWAPPRPANFFKVRVQRTTSRELDASGCPQPRAKVRGGRGPCGRANQKSPDADGCRYNAQPVSCAALFMKLNPPAHPRQLHGPRYASTGYPSGVPDWARAPGRLTLREAARA